MVSSFCLCRWDFRAILNVILLTVILSSGSSFHVVGRAKTVNFLCVLFSRKVRICLVHS